MASSTTIDTNHEDMIHDAQMDYYGKRLATSSSDRTIKILEIGENTNTQVAELKGHDGPVWQAIWAHPKFGSMLASCSYDRRVIVWKETAANTWSKVYEYDKHESSVNTIAWAPHEYGLMLACASSDCTISVHTNRGGSAWEVTRFQAHSIGVNSVSWAPAVSPSALVSSQPSAIATKRLASGGCDNQVKIWAFSETDMTWNQEHIMSDHKDWVRDVAWAPNVGLPHNILVSCSQDGSVYIWSQDAQGSTWTKKQELPKFSDVVWRVSWSITGNILAISGGDSKVTLWKESIDGEFRMISQLEGEN